MGRKMKRVLITGAAGGIGRSLRGLLRGAYPEIVLSDRVAPADLAPGERFVAADLADLAQVEAICE
ncbi:MAG: NAD(P)-dependent oxidoreductase, partial [Alphaproteobacteria bacterium]